MHHDIVVIGAGLSGAHAARLLHRAGADFVVLEAGERTGGRILSLGPGGGPGPLDMGPSWFWPAFQPRVPALIRDIGLRALPQANAGGLVWEESPVRCTVFDGGAPDDGSMRIHGGAATLVDALLADVPSGQILTGHRVTTLRLTPGGVGLEVACGSADPTTISARMVICTVPPRLLARSLAFDPTLPSTVRDDWVAVPTWMAGNAKFVAVYERPFWRDAGLSGEARSRVGPLVEVHDASDERGVAALTAFIGTPAAVRAGAGDALRDAAIAQLARLFGPEAARPTCCLVKDWASDPLVATPDDVQPLRAHPAYGAHMSPPGEWEPCLLLAGTESARTHGGYMEGALEAAEAAVAQALA